MRCWGNRGWCRDCHGKIPGFVQCRPGRRPAKFVGGQRPWRLLARCGRDEEAIPGLADSLFIRREAAVIHNLTKLYQRSGQVALCNTYRGTGRRSALPEGHAFPRSGASGGSGRRWQLADETALNVGRAARPDA